MSHFIVYIKADQSVCINHRKVLLKDFASIYCSEPEMTHELEKLELFTFPKERNSRKTISVLKLVEEIKKKYKDAEVYNLGEQDILVYYKQPGHHKKWMEGLKTAAICLTLFFGAAISIMGYNNDVGVRDVFSQIYVAAMGEEGSGGNFMHIFYAAGLLIGMLVFFNHASRKRLSDEPTPIEVQMRLYEKNVNATLITGSGRKEEELDADV